MPSKKAHSAFIQSIRGVNKDLILDSNSSLSEFLDGISDYLGGAESTKSLGWNIADYPLLPGQAMYLVKYTGETQISCHKGIQELLGYSNDEFNLDIILNYFHPQQEKIIQRILKGAVNYGATQNLESEKNTWMFLIYKGRRKDGEYIPLLRQTSVYERDDKGRMISAFSILSDLSGMNNTDSVEWKLNGPNVDQELFSKFIYSSYSDFFSNRECEILGLLQNGMRSKDIADKLFVSKSTVDTHRRNMLRKSDCANTVELINFALRNGVLSS